jgi:hypothetical protein
MAHIVAITHLITRNSLYIRPPHLPQSANFAFFNARLHSFLLPKNSHLGEAAAVGGWNGGAWELELNHMCV